MEEVAKDKMESIEYHPVLKDFGDDFREILGFPQKRDINKVTNLTRTMTSKGKLWPIKPILLHKKHENQPPNQKVVLPIAPFF